MNKPIRLHPSFYYLIGTQTLSNAADIIYIMGIVSLVMAGTDSILAGVFVPFFRSSSQLLSGLVASLMLVRFRLARLLLFCQFGQFVIFAVLALYLWVSREQASLPLIFTLIFAMSFLDGWTTPARNSLVPRLVHRDELLRANGMVSVSDQIIRCAGWAMGGILVAWIGALPTLMLAGIFYAVAMVFTAFIREPQTAEVENSANAVDAPVIAQRGEAAAPDDEQIAPAPASSEREYIKTLTEGWQLIWRKPKIRTLIFMDMVDMLGGSVWVGAFILAFVVQVLHQGEEWWGFINTAYFAGAIGGGLLVVGLVRWLNGREFRAMLLGIGIYSILTLVFAVTTNPYISLLLVVAMGPVAELAAVNRRTLLQLSVTREQLPKLLSAQDATLNFTFCISLLIMGWIAEQFGIVNLYLLAGIMSVCALVVGLLSRSAFRQKETISHHG
ncbi:MFS transporter [Paenibacillus dauci]|uniref:MFS transporter n=1 Tax=Paenibacillus dauci TaxID=1567106 RepID=UPI000619415C|nr:MFS transporter [Paenibacillus dauci]